MKKNFIVGIFFVTLLLYSNGLFDGFDKKKKMLFDVILKKYGSAKANTLSGIYAALKALNLPITTIRLALSQVMHETGVLSGKQRASSVNNFSGITYSGSAAQLATGAKKSSISLPDREQEKDKAGRVIESKRIYYAAYPSIASWSKDYIRQLQKGAKPIMAASPEDFAVRLKKNNYYADPVEVYAKALTLYNNFLTKAGI